MNQANKMAEVRHNASKHCLLRVCVCPWGGLGVLSQHLLQVVSQHALQQVSGRWYPSMPCRFPGPHPKGKFRGIYLARGIWSRPTTKGEIEGDLVQAHSQGGSWGESGPGPHPRGKLRGIWPGGCLLREEGVCSRGCVVCGDPSPPVMATAAGGTHPTGMHSCLLDFHKYVCVRVIWVCKYPCKLKSTLQDVDSYVGMCFLYCTRCDCACV